ncbi:MAG: pinensin family lanthipeptide [Bacteroidota bacterium]
MKSKKMKLSELKVESFVTGLQKAQSKTAKGGSGEQSFLEPCLSGATEPGAPGCDPDTLVTLDGGAGCNPSIWQCGSFAGC